MKKSNVVYTFISIISIFLIIGCTERIAEIPTNTEAKTEPAQKTSEINAITGNVGKEVEQKSQKEDEIKTQIPQKQEVKEKIYSMNEDINVDYLTYKVIKAETFTEMGTSFSDKKTNGKFIKVYLDITNTAKETKEIFTPRFKVIDNQERQFDRLSDDIFYIADYLEFGKQLQPSLTVSGAVVFELPKESENLNLIIRGDWVSTKEVKVALSNIKNIGIDTTQKEKVDQVIDEAMEESKAKVKELMNKCNSPFKCSSNCAKYSDVGQKDCPSGQVCCMTEQSEVDQLIDDLVGQSPETQSGETSKQEALNSCYKRAKECSDGILGIELELKSACMEIYMWTSGTSELLDFTKGLC
ncbi:DUF4352 domain-containing protein [Candidatus Woesearchaeota archaeon]|nr:DUF4352 domain-containing protein [Candidatus Woesearchaeota archaeon]